LETLKRSPRLRVHRPLLIRAKRIITCDTDAPQCGIGFDALGCIEDAAIFCLGGRVATLGPRRAVERELEEIDELFARTMRAMGMPEERIEKRFRYADDPHWRSRIVEFDFPAGTVVPGFVDAHTHPLFAGDRVADFEARLRGEPPPQGMRHTVERTREALLDVRTFWEQTVEPRLYGLLRHGTTTAEVKTGYALHEPGERALLDLIADHADDLGTPRLIATFLGAHALPPEFETEEAYVDYLIEHCLPTAKAHGAIYADVFCEPGYFSAVQARRYLEAARAHGLRLRAHCDEMGYAGAARMAAALGVDAADHCNTVTSDDVRALAERGVVMVACPATIEYLELAHRAPVREMLERGGTVALASDFNPGTSPCYNLQTVAHLGRKLFGLSAAEALYAVTLAAAESLHIDLGRLFPGAPADMVVLQMERPEEFGWQFGGNQAVAVFREGEIVP